MHWTPYFPILFCCFPFLNAEIDNVIDQQKHGCLEMLREFARKSAAFNFCTISHARPLLICQKCIEHYLSVKSVYNNIIKLQMTPGDRCKDELVNLDRLQVFTRGYEYVMDFWSRANCDGCFVRDNSTHDPTTQLTDLVVNILNSTNAYERCVDKYRNFTVKPDLAVCKNCSDSYQSANFIYDMKKGSVNLCVDIIDLMNRTRNKCYWSLCVCCNILLFGLHLHNEGEAFLGLDGMQVEIDGLHRT
ncbi:hypothetical protein GE061_012311 [Apolygus lucorum]|uniref:Osteopetrosis-associated transmembrane protein 1 n=1 Tax=Apolygus lucorum TaxID=248454 RepID=A0A6A4JWS0_APOLU|nr:hypothetical protein GE061_012311 [Apolygus lucorum]